MERTGRGPDPFGGLELIDDDGSGTPAAAPVTATAAVPPPPPAAPDLGLDIDLDIDIDFALDAVMSGSTAPNAEAPALPARSTAPPPGVAPSASAPSPLGSGAPTASDQAIARAARATGRPVTTLAPMSRFDRLLVVSGDLEAVSAFRRVFSGRLTVTQAPLAAAFEAVPGDGARTLVVIDGRGETLTEDTIAAIAARGAMLIVWGAAQGAASGTRILHCEAEARPQDVVSLGRMLAGF
jgi:hypothetical protein